MQGDGVRRDGSWREDSSLHENDTRLISGFIEVYLFYPLLPQFPSTTIIIKIFKYGTTDPGLGRRKDRRPDFIVNNDAGS